MAIIRLACLLSALWLLRLAHADAPGQLALYGDSDCLTIIPNTPAVSLAAGVCLALQGAHGIAIQQVPPCPTGSAGLALYSDNHCGRQMVDEQYYHADNCYWGGPVGGPALPAIAFTCNSQALKATATSSLAVGSAVLPVATGNAASAGSTATSTRSTSQATAGTSDSNNSTSGNTGSTTLSTSSSPSPSATGGSGSGGLSTRAQIIIGVCIPTAALIIAVMAWQCPKRMRHQPYY